MKELSKKVEKAMIRIEKVRKILEENKLDGLLLTSQPNIFYLSGFRSSHAYAVITPREKFFLTDSRYFEKAKEDLIDWQVIKIEGQVTKFLKEFFIKTKVKNLGYEKDKVTCYFKEKLKSPRYRLKGLVNPLKRIRMVKDEDELQTLKEGIKKTDQVFKRVLEKLSQKIGKEELTELKVRGMIVKEIFEIGASGESFPAIVASGEASAIPHWESSKKSILKNAPLLIDMGLIWNGYSTDFTRTLFVGKPDKEFMNFYEIVKTAWFKGFEKVKAGIKVSEIDKTIREYFNQKGVAEYFIHATGHGIGIEVHEDPRVYHLVDEEVIIEDGMVFTIEPGLYFEKKYGIRLENIVIVENGQGTIFSEIPLDLITLEV